MNVWGKIGEFWENGQFWGNGELMFQHGAFFIYNGLSSDSTLFHFDEKKWTQLGGYNTHERSINPLETAITICRLLSETSIAFPSSSSPTPLFRNLEIELHF